MRSVRMYSLSAVHVWLVVMSALMKMLAANAGAVPKSPANPATAAAIRTLCPLMFTRFLPLRSWWCDATVLRGVRDGPMTNA